MKAIRIKQKEKEKEKKTETETEKQKTKKRERSPLWPSILLFFLQHLTTIYHQKIHVVVVLLLYSYNYPLMDDGDYHLDFQH